MKGRKVVSSHTARIDQRPTRFVTEAVRMQMNPRVVAKRLIEQGERTRDRLEAMKRDSREPLEYDPCVGPQVGADVQDDWFGRQRGSEPVEDGCLAGPLEGLADREPARNRVVVQEAECRLKALLSVHMPPEESAEPSHGPSRARA